MRQRGGAGERLGGVGGLTAHLQDQADVEFGGGEIARGAELFADGERVAEFGERLAPIVAQREQRLPVVDQADAVEGSGHGGAIANAGGHHAGALEAGDGGRGVLAAPQGALGLHLAQLDQKLRFGVGAAAAAGFGERGFEAGGGGIPAAGDAIGPGGGAGGVEIAALAHVRAGGQAERECQWSHASIVA